MTINKVVVTLADTHMAPLALPALLSVKRYHPEVCYLYLSVGKREPSPELGEVCDAFGIDHRHVSMQPFEGFSNPAPILLLKTAIHKFLNDCEWAVFVDADTITVNAFDELFDPGPNCKWMLTKSEPADEAEFFRRLDLWESIETPQLNVRELVRRRRNEPQFINTGVFSFAPAFLSELPWTALAVAGAEREMSIPDEIAAQILSCSPEFSASIEVLDSRFNCNPTLVHHADSRIHHFWGRAYKSHSEMYVDEHLGRLFEDFPDLETAGPIIWQDKWADIQCRLPNRVATETACSIPGVIDAQSI